MSTNTPSRPPPSLLLALVAGLLWGVSSPTLLGAVGFLAGAAVAARALTGRVRADLAGALVASFAWQALALRWMPGALSLYGVGDGGRLTLALALVQTLPAALPWVTAGWLVRRGVDPAWALALAWLAWAEPVAALQPLPITPAMVVSGAVLGLWPAALGGIALLSAVAVGAGAGMPRRGGALALGLWALGGGFWLDQPDAVDTVTVAIAQPDTGAFDGRRASTADDRAARLLDLVRRAAGVELVVAPETAWPWSVGPDGSHTRESALAAWRDLPPLVIGVALADGPTNSVLAVADDAVVGRFDKVLRVPVTERRVGGWGEDAFVAGARPRTLTLSGLRLGPLVCYEDAHSGPLREAVALDPDLLVVVANDAWTGAGGATTWHVGATRLAAVSTGRAVVRAATSGPSMVLDSAGRDVAALPWVDGDTHPGPGQLLRATVARPSPAWAGVSVSPWLGALGGLVVLALAVRRQRPARPAAPTA